MPTYLHPGVYVEEIPSGSKPIEGVGTSVAAFVGYTLQGPMDEPTLISTWDEYEKIFGGIQDDVPDSTLGLRDPMGHSVYAFFQNGGTSAYIVRTTVKDSSATSVGSINDGGSPATNYVTFTVANPGKWGDHLRVRITPKGTVASPPAFTGTTHFTVVVGEVDDSGNNFSALETYGDVTFGGSDSTNIDHVISDASSLIQVETADATNALSKLGSLYATGIAATPPQSYVEVSFANGGNGTLPDQTAYDNVFALFTKIRDINIILLPGQVWPDGSGNAVISSAISHCESMKSRMVLVDVHQSSLLGDEETVTNLSLPTDTYCALYYPWVKVANPFYNPDTNPGAEHTVLVAPSAFGAGMWARTDGRRGVWKAPAGVETSLLGVAGLEFTVEDAEQDYLNPLGVNALRKLPGYGSVIWGARTLATKADPEWRYIPVRRTAIFIEQSVYNGIQWAVFEPNDSRLWSALRVNIESFMNGLFRAGAFQGDTAGDAYFVRCGLGSTMVQGDIDRGQVIVVVGFAPLKPAEFVIVRIQQQVAQQ